MLPFEFTVEGTPVSQQTKNRARLQAWKNRIRAQAAQYWPSQHLPVAQNVRVRIVYYYEGEALDIDNMVKPIQDALVGLVYSDDSQVTDNVVAKRSLDGSFRVKGMSPVLADGFCCGREFLHIRVEEAPSHEDLI